VTFRRSGRALVATPFPPFLLEVPLAVSLLSLQLLWNGGRGREGESVYSRGTSVLVIDEVSLLSTPLCKSSHLPQFRPSLALESHEEEQVKARLLQVGHMNDPQTPSSLWSSRLCRNKSERLLFLVA
jgi:hypothetical protein